jgi:two-component system, OmpR family, sensor histidine kinase KdpD
MLAGDAELLADLAGLRTGNGPADLALLTDEMRRHLGLTKLEVRQVGSYSNNGADGGADQGADANPDVQMEIDPGMELVGWGKPIDARSQRLLPIFATQLRSAVAQSQAAEQEALADDLRQADALKLSLLQTVSHDLRTPLGGIKAAVSSLRQTDVQWAPEDAADFLQTIEDNTDRLTAMVTNVLDFSRLQSGTLLPNMRLAALEEIVPQAVASLGERGRSVLVSIPSGCPDVVTDLPLLERIVANLVGNALTWSPAQSPVAVHATAAGNNVCLQIIDHGPGIAPQERARVMEPFERVTGNSPNASGGVGLGLAIAGGLSQAIGGSVRLRDTPGGGLTVEVTLPTGVPS